MKQIERIIKEEIKKVLKENFDHLEPKTLGDVTGNSTEYSDLDKLFASKDLQKMSPENLEILARKVRQDPELYTALKNLAGSLYDRGGFSKLSSGVDSLTERRKK